MSLQILDPTRIQLCLAYPCIHFTKTPISLLEAFQKRVLKWVLNDYASGYRILLSKIKMLPLSLFFQILDLLEFCNIYHNEQIDFKLWETSQCGRNNDS